jgi:Fic family protein
MKNTKPPILDHDLFNDQEAAARAFALLNHPVIERINARYHPWSKVRHIARQEQLDPLDLWRAVKLSRYQPRRHLPLARTEGGAFSFWQPPEVQEGLHKIDQHAGGLLATGSHELTQVLRDPVPRERFVIRSLMDEAIESSRLEGAVTTRREARDLLRSERKPTTPHERMVLNNYRAMRMVKKMLDRELSIEMLLDIQRVVTEGTLDDPDAYGRLRRVGEDVAVWDDRTNERVYDPPPAEGLEERVRAICAFANEDHQGRHFIHPVIKASILHFMIGYEHPFCDGNGRTARAVFYWSVLRSGYWMFEYLVISGLIRESYASYPRAFLNSEQDDGDLTYFIHYSVRIITLAIRRLGVFLENERQRVARSLQLSRVDPNLNLRQRLLLENALKHPRKIYTVKSHATTCNVTPTTARHDLEHLRQRGLLTTFKDGKQVLYMLAPDADAMLRTTE